jgi:hypothetical protein
MNDRIEQNPGYWALNFYVFVQKALTVNGVDAIIAAQ